ncbi:hypothetical protein KM295_14380 [Natronomonas sp. F2-12]|uniref:Uncharacterized protein n=1 Tax=Natronomonas aquatica TaxID=2841590 RepID=A0A9R1CSQ0_9EURY|nr:hypothetical protein [Natronomonas aquatica]MCQ4334643.1 hypothetical protein [Natronomonas aquatica]
MVNLPSSMAGESHSSNVDGIDTGTATGEAYDGPTEETGDFADDGADGGGRTRSVRETVSIPSSVGDDVTTVNPDPTDPAQDRSTGLNIPSSVGDDVTTVNPDPTDPAQTRSTTVDDVERATSGGSVSVDVSAGSGSPGGIDSPEVSGTTATETVAREDLGVGVREDVATRLDRQVDQVDVGADDVVRTSDGFGLDDETTGELARRQAAAQDPLRDPEDFVADTSGEDVSVRRRARPFFEDQREALGLNPPEESSIRRRLRSGSRSVQGFFDDVATRQEQAVPSAGSLAEDSDIPGSDQIPTVTPGDQTRGAGAVFDLPGAVDSAARVGERAANVGQASAESTAADLGLDGTFDVQEDALGQEIDAQQTAVGQTASDIETVARNDPGVLVGAIGTGVATSVGVGVGVGRGVTRARDAARTAGATEIDFGDVTNPSTRAFVEGDEGDPFPAVQDRDLAAEQPAEAIRQQADEFTPRDLETEFEDAGAPVGADESVMFRAVDTEPEGPGRSRADQGLETFGTERPFDPPGGFVSPELSPRFLGVEDAEFSPRPGLPDFGGRPTGVAVRTRVREPDASDFEGFRTELEERAGETDAFTNPDFSFGEAEAVIPPQAEFTPVSSGGLGRRAARAVGIGSDFEVNVAGRSVPLRTVADVEGRRGFLDDTSGSLGSGRGVGQSRRLDEFSSRGVRQRTDRPTAIPASSGAFGTSSPSAVGSSGFGLGLSSGASSPGSSGSSSGVSSPGSSGSSGGNSGASSGGSSGTSAPDGGAFGAGGSASGTAGLSGLGGTSGTSADSPASGGGSSGAFNTASGASGSGGAFGDGFGGGDDGPPVTDEEFPGDDQDLEDRSDILRAQSADLFESGIASAEELLTRGSN